MSDRCGQCQYFVDETELIFSKTLAHYSFKFEGCSSDHDGRECRALYRSPRVALLFILQDGSAGCLLGHHDTPFPPKEMIRGIGDHGWYDLSFLAEIEANQIIVTRKLLQEFIEGRVSEYEWQAALLTERAERLFPLLDLPPDVAQRERYVRQWESLGRR